MPTMSIISGKKRFCCTVFTFTFSPSYKRVKRLKNIKSETRAAMSFVVHFMEGGAGRSFDTKPKRTCAKQVNFKMYEQIVSGMEF